MLIAQGCNAGALIGQDGTPWALAGFTTGINAPYNADITQEDGTSVSTPINECEIIKNFVATGNAGPTGLRIGGKKFMVLRKTQDDGFTCYARCSKGGACIAKSATGIVVATFDENAGGNAGACNAAAEGLRSYLVSNSI